MTGDYALIEAGTVTNVIVCDEDFAAAYIAEDNTFELYVQVDELDPEPGIGWSYDATSGEFTAPPLPPVDEAAVAAAEQRVADQELVDTLLTKKGRTATQTQQLLDALARLAGVTPEDS